LSTKDPEQAVDTESHHFGKIFFKIFQHSMQIQGLISALPCVVDTTTILLYMSTERKEDVMAGIVAINCFCYWAPLLNPVSSILTNKPYRQAMAALLCCRPCRKKKNAKVAVTVVAPAK
jgi:hypothetical protein